jgi:putative thioredoxin
MADSPYIVVASEANFAQEVLERSHQVPVLVDFWAAWCAPCQMLLPVLSKLANEYQGRFILAKVNSDEQQALAAQFAIRSIPALKLFRHGKVVEDLAGAQPEGVIRALLERHIERPADKVRATALALHQAGQSEQALALLRQAMSETPEYYRIREDLAAILIDLRQLSEAERLLHDLPANAQAEASVSALMTRLNFAKVAESAPDTESLQTALDEDPKNSVARYQLSARKILAGDYQAALEHLLELMRQDRRFGDDAGRKGLLAVFALLGNEGELVSRYRSKMSSLLY